MKDSIQRTQLIYLNQQHTLKYNSTIILNIPSHNLTRIYIYIHWAKQKQLMNMAPRFQIWRNRSKNSFLARASWWWKNWEELRHLDLYLSSKLELLKWDHQWLNWFHFQHQAEDRHRSPLPLWMNKDEFRDVREVNKLIKCVIYLIYWKS